jgi:hypothetical protein
LPLLHAREEMRDIFFFGVVARHRNAFAAQAGYLVGGVVDIAGHGRQFGQCQQLAVRLRRVAARAASRDVNRRTCGTQFHRDGFARAPAGAGDHRHAVLELGRLVLAVFFHGLPSLSVALRQEDSRASIARLGRLRNAALQEQGRRQAAQQAEFIGQVRLVVEAGVRRHVGPGGHRLLPDQPQAGMQPRQPGPSAEGNAHMLEEQLLQSALADVDGGSGLPQ